MGAMLTEGQLRQHLPKLCKRLNADALLVSLSGVLGDTDEEIVRKKLERSVTESDGLIILYIYKAVKRTLGSDHVDCFLHAVQDQFNDLRDLGITVEAPNHEEKVAPLPRRHQPDSVRGVTGFRPCQQPNSESRVRDPATQNWHESSRVFPPRSMHPDTLPYSSCKSTPTADFHSVDWSSGVQRPILEPRHSEAMSLPLSRSSVPRADPDRTSQSCEGSGVTIREVIANLSGMNGPDCLPRHPQRMATHSSEPMTESPFPSTAIGSVRSGNPRVPETATVNNTENVACPSTNIPLNILTSVEDNTDNGTAFTDRVIERGEESSPQAVNPSGLTNSTSVNKVGNQPSPTADMSSYGNIQTDGDLPTHDVQPEQPEDLRENIEDGQGASDDPHHTTPPVNPMERAAPPARFILNIEQLIIQGKGNHVGLGGDVIFKTVTKSSGQQEEYIPHRGHEDEFTTLPEAASSSLLDQSDDTTAKLPISHLNLNGSHHQQTAELMEPPCLPDLSVFHSSNTHHDTKAKAALQNQAEEHGASSNFTDSNNSTKSDPTRDQEIGTEQNTNQPTCSFSKPGILLGPEELQRFEEQRDASIVLPDDIVFTSCSS